MGQGVLTSAFPRVEGALHCEGVPLAQIAATAGTPAFVYSAALIRERYRALDAVLSPVAHRVHYTLKANSNRAVLRLLRELGCGVDVVSGGELHRARLAGFAGRDIIFGGVGKTDDELREALLADVLLLNVESEAEVRSISRIAVQLGVDARVSLRVNPEVTVDAAHAYIKTGERGHKFGIPFDDALHVARVAAGLPRVTLLGLDMHLGSMLARVEPYRRGAERLAQLCGEIRAAGIATLRHLDVGGGLSVRYADETPLDLDEFADAVLPVAQAAGLDLLIEPGRFIVGNAGVLLTRVLYRKHSGGKEYAIADAGMTELLRPSYYNAYHRVEAVHQPAGQAVLNVVGPVCESGDFLALDRAMDDPAAGDLLAVFDAGAYGYVMASNYNSRRRAAEVLVDGDRYAVVTERETYDDMVRREVDQPDWRQ
ncbi:MAG TPA: diaminopimelate decarboxylase [Gemmatimonadaceae bacterium]|nr:diaminopimelate decarboxylase [Gemmatimonadaceae bacterium]